MRGVLLVLKSHLVMPILICLWLGPFSAQAQLLSRTVDSIVVAVDEGSDRRLTITIKAPKLKSASVFGVESPSRIVTDLEGVSIRAGTAFALPVNPSIAKLRFGTHPEKTRIVIDLKTKSPPQFSWKQEHETVSIEIPSADSSHAPPIVTTSKAAEPPSPVPTEPRAEPAPAATSTATAASTRQREAAPAPSPTPAPIPTTPASAQAPTPTPVPPQEATVRGPSQGQILTNIIFDDSSKERGPSIRLVLTQRPQFRLARKDDRSYVITINGAGLSSVQLALAQFPPQNFVGLTVVQASQSEQGLTITIGVDRGVKVAAFSRDTEIIITVAG